MGFSIKIAPGVRVRASSRGVRTSIGPRVARVHVGAGRARTRPISPRLRVNRGSAAAHIRLICERIRR
jgi:hypothetical protein